MKPILVTGGTGQVGTALKARAGALGAELVTPGRDALDLLDAGAIDAAVAARDWGAIINCAAYTAVDEAEREPARAFALNAGAPGRLAAAAAARGIRLIHLSTDYVFDGSQDGYRLEDDAVAPLGVYGASKHAGEQAVCAAGGNHLIVRTAWVVSPWRRNFIRTMLRLGAAGGPIRVVDDQRGCPTSALDLADALLAITARGDGPGGTVHIVNAGEASWFELARFVFVRAGLRVDLRPIATGEYPTPARRPANSRLATERLRRDFGIDPRPWPDAVGEIVDALTEAA